MKNYNNFIKRMRKQEEEEKDKPLYEQIHCKEEISQEEQLEIVEIEEDIDVLKKLDELN